MRFVALQRLKAASCFSNIILAYRGRCDIAKQMCISHSTGLGRSNHSPCGTAHFVKGTLTKTCSQIVPTAYSGIDLNKLIKKKFLKILVSSCK